MLEAVGEGLGSPIHRLKPNIHTGRLEGILLEILSIHESGIRAGSALAHVRLHFRHRGAQQNAVWWSLSLVACLGGNGSLIGASANLITAGIAERQGHPIHFLKFILHAFPLMLMSVAIASVYVWLRYLN